VLSNCRPTVIRLGEGPKSQDLKRCHGMSPRTRSQWCGLVLARGEEAVSVYFLPQASELFMSFHVLSAGLPRQVTEKATTTSTAVVIVQCRPNNARLTFCRLRLRTSCWWGAFQYIFARCLGPGNLTLCYDQAGLRTTIRFVSFVI
jgi:hypothetical protein